MRLQVIGLGKRYGPTRALHEVQLELAAGEIHALLGENGAGKSTLVRILSGEEHPDHGMIFLDGERYAPASPLQARKCGVAVVGQESALAGDLSVEENLTLGSEPARRGWIDRRLRREMARWALEEIKGEDIPLKTRVQTLSLADRQRVEIARAFLADPKVLLLDEPTRSLSHWETGPLFAALRRLAANGVSVLYISHFLEESQALCTRYTVLRDGERVASGAVAEANREGLIQRMGGGALRETRPRSRHYQGKPLLQWRRVSGRVNPRCLDLTLHAGEILGLAGLDGAGRAETLRLAFGLERLREGEVRRHGMLGFATGSEPGMLPSLSIADNLTLPCLGRFGAFGFLSMERQRFTALDWMEKLRIRARSPQMPGGDLSSGNRQKVILGRLLLQQASVLLLNEPTRGIDVLSKGQIYEMIDAIACEGKGIVWVSSDPAELLGWCDTIALMRQGKLVEARPASEWTEPEIIAAAMGPP